MILLEAHRRMNAFPKAAVFKVSELVLPLNIWLTQAWIRQLYLFHRLQTARTWHNDYLEN